MSETELVNKRLNPKRNESENIFNSEPVAFRPSSRVLNRPGGKTSDIFGLAALEPQVQKARLPIPGGTPLNIFSEAPENSVVSDVHRRDPNHMSNEETRHRSSRQYSGDSNKSHFSFGGNESENAGEVKSSFRRQLPQSQQTSFSFDESVTALQKKSFRRDPNAQSQETVHRPSSRVLSRPGGKQNFTFA